jgi:putative two-component system response regulator
MTDKDKRKKILCIDDDPAQLAQVVAMLEAEYDIYTVRSGTEALSFLYQGHVPHLILLDILMPNMNGWEAYNRIRAICCLRNTPILFVTSLVGSDEIQRGLAMGALDYITKPYERADLLRRIQSALRDLTPAKIA